MAKTPAPNSTLAQQKQGRPVPQAVLGRADAQGKVSTALQQIGYSMADKQIASVNVLQGSLGIIVVGAHTVKLYRGGEVLERNLVRQTSTSSLASHLTLTGDFDEFVKAFHAALGG